MAQQVQLDSGSCILSEDVLSDSGSCSLSEDVLSDSGSCSLCKDNLREPVVMQCGHSFCRKYLLQVWERQSLRFSCPQCRQSISPTDTSFTDLMKQMKMARGTAPPAECCNADPQDVLCDVCAERKLTAVRSCLQCMASFCESHLQPHDNAAVFQNHQLVAPSHKLYRNICPQHNKALEFFCRTDQQLLCSLCADLHQDHHTVPTATESAQRQAQLPARRALLLHSLQNKELDLDRLHQEAQNIRHSAQTAVQRSQDSFREMVLLLEKRRSEVEQQIWSEQGTKLRQVQELQDQLQQDVTELKRSISELDTLSLTPDHNQFILLYPSLSTDSQRTDLAWRQTELQQHFQSVTSAVSALSDKLHLTLDEDLRNYSPLTDLRSLPEHTSREHVLQHSQQITLDPNTVQRWLCLSDGNTRATVTAQKQSYVDHPDRFTDWGQVLSTDGMTGHCYWEVEWGQIATRIAVSYRDIHRKGDYGECRFGNSDRSWALYCDRVNQSYSFSFNSVQTQVSGPLSSRIGVFLDHSAGVISFYSVSYTMTLLHRVYTTFTQPVYAGVGLGFLQDTAHFPKL